MGWRRILSLPVYQFDRGNHIALFSGFKQDKVKRFCLGRICDCSHTQSKSHPTFSGPQHYCGQSWQQSQFPADSLLTKLRKKVFLALQHALQGAVSPVYFVRLWLSASLSNNIKAWQLLVSFGVSVLRNDPNRRIKTGTCQGKRCLCSRSWGGTVCCWSAICPCLLQLAIGYQL